MARAHRLDAPFHEFSGGFVGPMVRRIVLRFFDVMAGTCPAKLSHGRTMDDPNGAIYAKASGGKTLASIISTTVAFALARGMTMDEIERVTGLSGGNLVDPNARLPDSALHKLWLELVARAGPDEALSIEMARAAPFSMLGGLAHGAQFASDLRAGLDLFIRNRVFLCDWLELQLHDADDETALIGNHPLDPLDSGRTQEVGMGITARVLNEIVHIDDALIRIEFSHDRCGPQEAYEDFFAVPVLFNQSRNAMVFRREAMNTPICHASVDLFAFVENHFDQIRQRLQNDKYPTDLLKLRQAIVENSTRGDYRAFSAASRAHMSLRTAQRLAASHGTSLQKLIDEIRWANATEFLSDPAMNLETIATMLGYSDVRAFTRAFKRWSGTTPSKFRDGRVV